MVRICDARGGISFLGICNNGIYFIMILDGNVISRIKRIREKGSFLKGSIYRDKHITFIRRITKDDKDFLQKVIKEATEDQLWMLQLATKVVRRN